MFCVSVKQCISCLFYAVVYYVCVACVFSDLRLAISVFQLRPHLTPTINLISLALYLLGCKFCWEAAVRFKKKNCSVCHFRCPSPLASGKLVRNVLNVCQKCTEHFLPTCCTVTFFTCKDVLCRRLVANSYGNFLLEIYDSVVANSFCKCPMNVAANLCQISHFLVLWCLSCYTN